MRGGRDDVLGTLLGCNRPMTVEAVAQLVQNSCYAEDTLGFCNVLRGILTSREDHELPVFPPLRRIQRSLRSLERLGYASATLGQGKSDGRWHSHYATTAEGEAYYYRHNPHMKPV